MWEKQELEVVREIALGSWSRTFQLVLLLLAAALASAVVAVAGKLVKT